MMHLAHASLSLNGKKKGKQKFRNAEAARQARQLDEEWKELQKKWGTSTPPKRKKPETLSYSLTTPPGRETQKIASRDTGHVGAVNVKESKKYTGTMIKGIATMHKSNAVPVLNQEDAEAISKMRR